VALYDKCRIQNRLVALAKAGPFYPVTYDVTTKVATVSATALAAAQIDALANETACRFVPSKLNRRSLVHERDGWTFELRIQLQSECVLEAFEDAILQDPPKLLKDPANGLNYQVRLLLVDSRVTHPIQQEASTGTHVIYTFAAERTPA
jgi:hypothetical protein